MGGSTEAIRGRDVRLDVFRGLALWCIFVDHVPGNVLSQLTLQNFGPSNAADIFVFISGCSVALGMAPAFTRAGLVGGTARVVQRMAVLYASHLLLFMFLAGMVLARGGRLVDEMGLGHVLAQPDDAITRVLTLQYLPQFLDILPLYIVLLAMVPLASVLFRRGWKPLIAASLGLYLAAQLDWIPLPAPVGGTRWLFHPAAWQLIFFLGFALCMPGERLRIERHRALTVVATVVVVLGCLLSAAYKTREDYGLSAAVWSAAGPWVDKGGAAPLRLLHFVGLTWLTAQLLRGREHVLKTLPARVLILCGRQALPIFCLGVLLSVGSTIAMDAWGKAWWMQAAVNVGGVVVMAGSAWLLTWLDGVPWKPHAAGRVMSLVERRPQNEDQLLDAA